MVFIKLRLLFFILLALCTPIWGIAWGQSPSAASADQVFSSYEKSVFQIRIVEEKSGSQVALGTGFLVAPDQLATNYHVVSFSVWDPEKYRIEVDWQERKLQVSVMRVDVVNDLALLRLPEPLTDAPRIFILARTSPKKGEHLYSLGNPHNLGMTIVEGTYNGLVEKKYLDRIHFSGAINSGMSGGPTVNRQSEVVGINVATAGNQVGFLVPVAALAQLLAAGDEADDHQTLLSTMATQIATVTDGMVEALLQAEWPREEMGQALILGELVSWFNCWGNSNLEKETGTLEIARGCNNADNIYISERFNSGFMEYEFFYFEAEDWGPAAFYRHMRANTANARPGNKGGKDDLRNYTCKNQIVVTDNADNDKPMRRRLSYCVRPYKKLPGLFDVFFIGVSMDRDNRAIMDHFTLAGVTSTSAQRFLEKFVGILAWR